MILFQCSPDFCLLNTILKSSLSSSSAILSFLSVLPNFQMKSSPRASVVLQIQPALSSHPLAHLQLDSVPWICFPFSFNPQDHTSFLELPETLKLWALCPTPPSTLKFLTVGRWNTAGLQITPGIRCIPLKSPCQLHLLSLSNSDPEMPGSAKQLTFFVKKGNQDSHSNA